MPITPQDYNGDAILGEQLSKLMEKEIRDRLKGDVPETLAHALCVMAAEIDALKAALAERNLGDRTADSVDAQELKVGGVNALPSDGDSSDTTVAFSQASSRGTVAADFASGSKLSTLFGKIRKWFADLKDVAFSGSYTDLSDKPSIPDVSGKLNINGDNATAAGSSAIVDKISYNHIPTINENSKILQKNVEGWSQVDLIDYLGYLTTEKHFPIMESVSTTVGKTVASGEENAITLGNVNFPTRRTRYAIAIVTVQFKVDSNYGQIDLSQVSREAEFSLEDTGSVYPVPMAIVKNFNDLNSCVTFQMSLAPAYYPSTLEADVYNLNAPIGVSLRASVRITTLGTGQLHVAE